jgi:hypothetical protein
MIDDVEWIDWSDCHCSIFGLQSKDDQNMCLLWAEIFALGGYSPAELTAASKRMALVDPPKWRDKHLSGLKSALQAIRAEKEGKALSGRSGEPEGAFCAICGDPATGWALVPNTSPEGMAKRLMCVVFCKCGLGEWRRKTTGPIKSRGKECRIMSLDDYELKELYDWRVVLADWKRERKLEIEANATSAVLDKRLGRLADIGAILAVRDAQKSQRDAHGKDCAERQGAR